MRSGSLLVESLAKRYLIGDGASRYGRLTDSLSSAARRLVKRGERRHPPREIWALKEVSFELKDGSATGLIGRNGSGKTTLLRILSRITEPTSGRALVTGRVGSLLEVGTGFHPELTGRENVFLNGAILGMSRRAILRRFDEIVAFAETERFLDTPIKRYSTGMQTRLAFAVAAHLEPEILVVDEVLAVGDTAFQRKCLGKMDSAVSEGRTVLFVSHQMNQIRHLCDQVLWLDRGELVGHGDTPELVSKYESSVPNRPGPSFPLQVQEDGQEVRFLSWTLRSDEGKDGSQTLDHFGPVQVEILLDSRRKVRNGHHGLHLYDATGRIVWSVGIDDLDFEPGVHRLVHKLESLPLRPGAYHWYMTLLEKHQFLAEWREAEGLLVTTPLMTHRQDAWAGVLNVPSQFLVTPSN